MRILGMALFVLLWWASGTEAACSGSGTTWSCTAGTTSAQLATLISSASDGATATFTAGSYTWNTGTNFSNANGVTLICASVGACTVTAIGMTLGLNGTCTGTTTKLYRISGFVFNGGDTLVWYNAYNQGAAGCTMTNIRIDHNTFSNQSANSRIFLFGDNNNPSYFYGVVDHNTITNSSSVVLAEFISNSAGTPSAGPAGSVNNMFFENNTMTITTMTNPGAGCMDSTGSSAVVWRFNTMTNCLLTTHGVTHGGGIINDEIYGNSFLLNANADVNYQNCDRAFHHQGSGETLVFNNTFTCNLAYGNGGIAMTHYRSATPANAGYTGVQCDGTQGIDGNRTPLATYRGYPCKRQPGRDVNALLRPMYVWNNVANGSNLAIMTIGTGLWPPPEYVAEHIQLNRDIYNAVSINAQSSSSSPFTGTTGMGFGTFANRPTTCTTGPEALDAGHGGVGYWATDQGTWFNGGAGGVLYRCTATNTWTVHYTPYTYPHPLQAGGGGGDIVPPSAPTNLKVQ